MAIPLGESTRLSIGLPSFKNRSSRSSDKENKGSGKKQRKTKARETLKPESEFEKRIKETEMLKDVKNRYSAIVSKLPGNAFHHTSQFDVTHLNSTDNCSPLNSSKDKLSNFSDDEWDSLSGNSTAVGSKRSLFGGRMRRDLLKSTPSQSEKRRLKRTSSINPLVHGPSTLMNIKLEPEESNSTCGPQPKVASTKTNSRSKTNKRD